MQFMVTTSTVDIFLLLFSKSVLKTLNKRSVIASHGLASIERRDESNRVLSAMLNNSLRACDNSFRGIARKSWQRNEGRKVKRSGE